MGLMDEIKSKAKKFKKRIVLPEGTEERTIKAAEIISKEGFADVTLIGNVGQIKELSAGLDYSNVSIIDPGESDKLEAYADKFYELRKSKGITPEEARKQVLDPLYYACMMIKMGRCGRNGSRSNQHYGKHTKASTSDYQNSTGNFGRYQVHS